MDFLSPILALKNHFNDKKNIFGDIINNQKQKCYINKDLHTMDFWSTTFVNIF